MMELGRPVVVVVQQVFAQAAATQATLLGGPALPICAYREPWPGDTEASDVERARGAVDTIAGLLARTGGR
jgi:hypothetical protein